MRAGGHDVTRWIALLALLGAAATSAPAVHVVAIEGMAFRPPAISVREGDVVEFQNHDYVEHTATAADGSFDSGHLKQGEHFRWIAKGKGPHLYACTLHVTMKGSIEVR